MLRVFFSSRAGYSRRIFVRASLSQRPADWREGTSDAFRRFDGVTQQILINRAGALVVGQDRVNARPSTFVRSMCSRSRTAHASGEGLDVVDEQESIPLGRVVCFSLAAHLG